MTDECSDGKSSCAVCVATFKCDYELRVHLNTLEHFGVLVDKKLLSVEMYNLLHRLSEYHDECHRCGLGFQSSFLDHLVICEGPISLSNSDTVDANCACAPIDIKLEETGDENGNLVNFLTSSLEDIKVDSDISDIKLNKEEAHCSSSIQVSSVSTTNGLSAEIPSITCVLCNQDLLGSTKFLQKHAQCRAHKTAAYSIKQEADNFCHFKCNSCSEYFQNLDSAMEHCVLHRSLAQAKLDEDVPFALCCTKCESSFPCNYDVLRSHMKGHTPGRRKSTGLDVVNGLRFYQIRCNICDIVLTDFEQAREHIENHEVAVGPSNFDGDIEYFCANCNIGPVSSIGEVKAHRAEKNHQEQLANDDQRFVCMHCGVTFRDVSDMENHIEVFKIRKCIINQTTPEKAINNSMKSADDSKSAMDDENVNSDSSEEDIPLSDLLTRSAKTCHDPNKEWCWTEGETDSVAFICMVCEIGSLHLHDMRAHASGVRHGKNIALSDRLTIFKCRKCNQKFETADEVLEHCENIVQFHLRRKQKVIEKTRKIAAKGKYKKRKIAVSDKEIDKKRKTAAKKARRQLKVESRKDCPNSQRLERLQKRLLALKKQGQAMLLNNPA